MTEEEIKFSDKEVFALLNAYFVACAAYANIKGLKETPQICREVDKDILFQMQLRLLGLIEKYGHSKDYTTALGID